MKKNSTKEEIIKKDFTKNLVIINPEKNFLIVEMKDFGQYDHLLKDYDKTLVNGVFNYFHLKAKVYFTGEVLENIPFKKEKPTYSRIDMIVFPKRDNTDILPYDLTKEGTNKKNFSQIMGDWGLENVIVKEIEKYQGTQKFEISNKKHTSLIYLSIIVNEQN